MGFGGGAVESAAMNDTQGVRISKLMAERGLCSRREADVYIGRGLVFVDGERITELGTRASPDATITLAGEARAHQASQATILLHKPINSGDADSAEQSADGGRNKTHEQRHQNGNRE